MKLLTSLISVLLICGQTAFAQFNAPNPSIPSSITFAGQTVNFDRNDMYERFDRELTALAYTHGNTLLTIKRANKYFPIISPILKRYGVPQDLLYLACIESYLDPRALSPSKAAGLWQFVPVTAKQYGLEVNDYVDERYNIEKETEAACKFLLSLKNRFGSWESVAAAYNAGNTRIANELDSQGVRSTFDLYLPEETSRYMFRLFAMKEIMENPTKYGFTIKPSQLYNPINCSTVTVSGSVEDWQKWAQQHGTNYMTLRDLNPWIRAKSLPNKTGKTYQVLLPKKNSLSRSSQTAKVFNPAWTQQKTKQ